MQSIQNQIKKFIISYHVVFLIFILLFFGVIFIYAQYVKAQFVTKDPEDRLTANNWNSLQSEFGIPIGTIISFGGSGAPAGWIMCNGSAILRTGLFVNLFATIGTSFGNGDGSTTFNLPDLRGRTPLGADNMGGVDADNVTSASADIVGASGGNADGGHTHNGTTLSHGGSTVNGGPTWSETIHSHTFTTNSTDAMNPYQTVNYIIKY